MADKTGDDDKSGKRSLKGGGGGGAVASVRTRLAQLVWLFFLIAALFLAVGALCIALDFNRDNPLVEFVIGGADLLDLGIFSRDGGIKEFTEGGKDSQETKNALFNWGIGAIAYLIVGRILDRVIRP
ncbi:MAG: hypothetical protein ACRDOM_10070 [Nocardioides sp.]